MYLILLFVILILIACIAPLLAGILVGILIGVWIAYKKENFLDSYISKSDWDPLTQIDPWTLLNIPAPDPDTPIQNADLQPNVTSTFQPQEQLGSTGFSAGAYNFDSPEAVVVPDYQIPLLPINGDDGLSRLQTHRSHINEKAITGAVRTTRNYYEKFFVEPDAPGGMPKHYQGEVPEQEDRVWYSWEAHAGPDLDDTNTGWAIP